MIKLLVIILVALLLGVGLSLGLQYDLGYVRISLGHYLIETNFWVGLAGLLLLVAGILLVIGLLRRTRRSAGLIGGWLARGNERRARRRTAQEQPYRRSKCHVASICEWCNDQAPTVAHILEAIN